MPIYVKIVNSNSLSIDIHHHQNTLHSLTAWQEALACPSCPCMYKIPKQLQCLRKFLHYTTRALFTVKKKKATNQSRATRATHPRSSVWISALPEPYPQPPTPHKNAHVLLRSSEDLRFGVRGLGRKDDTGKLATVLEIALHRDSCSIPAVKSLNLRGGYITNVRM